MGRYCRAPVVALAALLVGSLASSALAATKITAGAYEVTYSSKTGGTILYNASSSALTVTGGGDKDTLKIKLTKGASASNDILAIVSDGGFGNINTKDVTIPSIQAAREIRKLTMVNGHSAMVQAMDVGNIKMKAAADLAARYRQLIGIDERLERLDMAVAENEQRIKRLTREAHEVVARYEFQKVEGLLKAAEKLQSHNVRLCKRIERTEQKLMRVAQEAANEARGE